MLLFLLLIAAEALQESPSSHWTSLGELRNFVVQRAIQTQLFYLTSTRDTPKAAWLARFMGHEHLDSGDEGRAAAMGEGGVGEGGDPFSYRARLDGLRCSYEEYLVALRSAPVEVVKVEIAPSRARLSTMERNNPYLAKQKLQSFFYDDTIEPARIAQRLTSTAVALAETWAPELAGLAREDDDRVYFDSLENPALSVPRVPQFEDNIDVDDSMPLFDHDKRALERWCTLVAASRLLEDLRGEEGGGGGDMVPEFDASLLVGSSRRRARESLGWSSATLRPRLDLEREATAAYFGAFVDEWMPRLVPGADDVHRAILGKPPPGAPRRVYFPTPGRGEADADEALEALFLAKPPTHLPGGYLVDPAHIATSLRAYRARVAYQAESTLSAFKSELLAAPLH